MKRFLIVCGFLIQIGALSASETNAFDYDSALASSQAALGLELGNHQFSDHNGRRVELMQLRGKPLVLSLI